MDLSEGNLMSVSAPIASTESNNCCDDVVNDDQEETSKFETSEKPLLTEWTNEKHSLYLKSIEASFVDQLYCNMGFPAFNTSKKSEPKPHLRSSVRTSAGQFKTLRGGYWQKINVGKGEHQSDGKSTPYDILSNPWIRHYIHSDRNHIASVSQGKEEALDQEVNAGGKAALPYRFNRSLKISNAGPSNSHIHVFSDDDDTEASGQNFVNEDIMEENSSSLRSTELVKTPEPMNDFQKTIKSLRRF